MLMIGAMRAESYKYHNFWKLFMRLESLLPFTKGLSSTIILSLHLLSWCTYFESIVAILISMCIVPRLVDWCITWYCLFQTIISSHSYELWRCPMHLYLLLYEGQAEYYYAMFSLCETNKRLAKHCYSWIFCLCLFMLHHSFFAYC